MRSRSFPIAGGETLHASTLADRDSGGVMIEPMTYELGQGTGPLRGVKVVEVAGIGPGPHACMILADLGADVIRVDRPGGGMFGTGDKDLLNRGRPSVALDLKRPEAVATVLDLVEQADVLVEGMRPGAIERLGLGPDECHARNPRLVFAPDDRLGPGRPVEPGRRPRHELHRDHRRPPRARPGPRPTALPEQPARRLRRRVDVPRHRHPRRPPRGAHQRAGAGRRRRDRRRHRPPQRDRVDLRRRRARLPGAAHRGCSTAARPGTTSTRPPTASTSASARWSRSSGPRSSSASASSCPTATTRPTTPRSAAP